MKYLLASLLLFVGCSSATPMKGLFTAQVADKVQVADSMPVSIKVADKVADKVELSPEIQIGAGNSVEKNTTSVGGNQAITNDTKLMTEILNTYKDLTERYINLLKYIIYGMAGSIASLISLLAWALKFLLQEDSDSDKFMQGQINK